MDGLMLASFMSLFYVGHKEREKKKSSDKKDQK